ADAARGEELLELLPADEVADRLLLQLLLPVQTDCARDVALVVRSRVHVDLDEAHLRIALVLRHPLGVDEHLGMCVLGHDVSPLDGLVERSGRLPAAAARAAPPSDRRSCDWCGEFRPQKSTIGL